MSEEMQWEFTTSRPGLSLFLVDQSASMHLSVNAHGLTSADRATRIVNHAITRVIARVGQEPVTRATPHICDVAIWAYGENPWPVAPNGGSPIALGYLADHDRRGPGWQDELMIPAISKSPQVNASAIGRIGRWMTTESGGPGSNLVGAISTATELIEDWLTNPIYSMRHSSAPPIVVHISDGENDRSSDHPSLLQQGLQKLRALRTDVGPICFVNVGLPNESTAAQIFPAQSSNLERNELLLWHISSSLPAPLLRRIRQRYTGQAKRLPWFKRIAQEDEEIDKARHAYLSHPDETVIAEILSTLLS